jgi:hypothetical protein
MIDFNFFLSFGIAVHASERSFLLGYWSYHLHEHGRNHGRELLNVLIYFHYISISSGYHSISDISGYVRVSHDNTFNQVLDHLKTIQNSLLLLKNITMVTSPMTSEASTQTETVLPPPIARTTPRTIPPTSYRNMTVVHHLIDDRTNNNIDKRTIHASSV